MSTMRGMDVTAVARTAGQLNEAAETFARLGRELEAGVTALPWSGPDAEAFRARWHEEITAAFDEITTALHALESSARANALDQERTSAR